MSPPGDRLLAAGDFGGKWHKGLGRDGGSPFSMQALVSFHFQHRASLSPSSWPGSLGLSFSGLSIEQTSSLLLGRGGILAVWVGKIGQEGGGRSNRSFYRLSTKSTRHSQASGPLHLLFPLMEAFFPQLSE